MSLSFVFAGSAWQSRTFVPMSLIYTNDGKENIVDDYCALLAATELYRATKNLKYKEAADKRVQSLMARLTTSGKSLLSKII